MASEKTLRWTTGIIRIGSFFKIFPVIWDPQEECVRSNYGKYTLFSSRWSINIGKLFQVIYILLCISLAVHLTHFLLFLEHNRMDFYFSVVGLFILGMSLVAQINFYYWSDDIFRVYNMILILDKRLCKYICMLPAKNLCI